VLLVEELLHVGLQRLEQPRAPLGEHRGTSGGAVGNSDVEGVEARVEHRTRCGAEVGHHAALAHLIGPLADEGGAHRIGALVRARRPVAVT